MGMDLPKRGGNVVLDELHFETSLYMYKSLEAKGVQLRVVKHRNWSIDLNDMERAIDRNTRLVSMALVSNVNGYLHDARAISDLAHAKGAYVFADMVQAAGAVPMDVRAMGIDFGSAATYKWLMGERGFGFLYVRERSAGHRRARRPGTGIGRSRNSIASGSRGSRCRARHATRPARSRTRWRSARTPRCSTSNGWASRTSAPTRAS